MATATNTPNFDKMGIEVSASKQTVTDEQGKIVKSLYFLKIKTPKGEVQLNVGEKTYTSVKQLTNK